MNGKKLKIWAAIIRVTGIVVSMCYASFVWIASKSGLYIDGYLVALGFGILIGGSASAIFVGTLVDAFADLVGDTYENKKLLYRLVEATEEKKQISFETGPNRWKCPVCGMTNESFSGVCRCGASKP
ncbi:MAG: hypothetical protein KBS85_00270 [Lachnospiraceae bacterium]|nr:hypothetical protein [Candidatus Merdinaster equi]